MQLENELSTIVVRLLIDGTVSLSLGLVWKTSETGAVGADRNSSSERSNDSSSKSSTDRLLIVNPSVDNRIDPLRSWTSHRYWWLLKLLAKRRRFGLSCTIPHDNDSTQLASMTDRVKMMLLVQSVEHSFSMSLALSQTGVDDASYSLLPPIVLNFQSSGTTPRIFRKKET